MSETLLTIAGLKIEALNAHGWQEIVHGVDLQVARGEVLGLIGESGAGKSTIGLAAMAYARNGCRISAGKILFQGQDLRGLSPAQLRRLRGRHIAYVAQSAAASFNPAHRLIHQCSEAPLSHGLLDRMQAHARTIDLYQRLALPDPEHIGWRYPHQVSGGQLQRIMTAMAMSCRPDLIIFDEPTTALDVTTQLEVLSAIRNIVRNFNTAALYITHDLAVVAQMADRIKVLYQGREVEEQTTRGMLRQPREPYSKSLWSVRQMQRTTHPLPEKTRAIVQVDHVSAHYGTQQVLDQVNFDLYAGHTLALVGESGSGKSTMARVLAGLFPPSSGSITLHGEILPVAYRHRRRDMLRQIQMIYQNADTALNPRQTVADIVGRPFAFYHGITGRTQTGAIAEILEMMEMDPAEFMKRTPTELSGGQKQRIGIARALAARPSVIICDEVTSSLDQLVAEGILQILQKIQAKTGMAYLFITHDLSAVKAIADTCAVMCRGRLVEQGNVHTIMQQPSHAYTRELMGCVPKMDPDWLEKRLTRRTGDVSHVQN